MTQTERELQRLSESLAVQTQRWSAIEIELEDLWEEIEKIDNESDELREKLSASQTQIELLKAGFDEFKKRWEESDRRRWTIYGVMLAATLTFVANLVLLVLRK